MNGRVGDRFEIGGEKWGLLGTATCKDEAIQYAIIHGALTMTTPGDNSMVSQSEVEAFLNARHPGINR